MERPQRDRERCLRKRLTLIELTCNLGWGRTDRGWSQSHRSPQSDFLSLQRLSSKTGLATIVLMLLDGSPSCIRGGEVESMKPLLPLLSVATDYSDVTNRHLGIWSKNPSLAPSLHCAGPGSRSISRFLQQAAPPSLGPGPSPDQRLHTRAGLLSPQVSQAWSCESKGRSCAKGPRIKVLAPPRFGGG